MNTAVILEERPDEGITNVNGKPYMADAKGALVPLELVKAADKLEDETVRKIIGFASDLSARIARFRGHTMADLGEFDALLEQEYGVTKGGKKGNRTYQTFDGLMKVTVQVADQITFGPQLQSAKKLFDECVTDWSVDSGPELRGVITDAFNTDKEGKIDRNAILKLLRREIDDERWKKAQDAIRDAIRVIGSKEYVRFYARSRITDGWLAVTIDLAKAGA